MASEKLELTKEQRKKLEWLADDLKKKWACLNYEERINGVLFRIEYSRLIC